MEEIIKLVLERNTKRRILSKDDIKRICMIIINLKNYQDYVSYINFFTRNLIEEDLHASYDGVGLNFYLEKMQSTEDTTDFLDGTKVDYINFNLLNTIFHELAHVRQNKMMSNNSKEAMIYRFCSELCLLMNDQLYEDNYSILLNEVNARAMGNLNAYRIYRHLPKSIITKNDLSIYKAIFLSTILEIYDVNLKKEIIISPSEQLIKNMKKNLIDIDYNKLENVINSCNNYSLYHKLMIGLPISFESYAYANMFLTHDENNETFIKKIQNHK